MNIRAILPLTALLLSAAARAQHFKGVVVDMETGRPLRGVEVLIDGSYTHKTTTDYTGTFTLTDSLREVTLLRQGYEHRIMLRSELTDTIALLPLYNKLNEVVIYGREPGKHMPLLTLVNGQLKEMKLLRPKTGISCDLLSWLKVFEKGHVSAKKRKERLDAIKDY